MVVRRNLPGMVVALAMAACSDGGSSTDEGTGGSTSADATTTDAAGTSTGTPASSDGTAASSTGTDGSGTTTGAAPEGYDDPALWLCHPDLDTADDQCRGADLSATEVFPDGTTQLVEHVVAEDPAYDCFYIYPTVDIRLTPGQTENFDDITQELDPLWSQAARFSGQCRVFAPLYHQVTLGTFASAEAPALLDAAYADVEAAFTSYLDNHGGDRPFVIMGHSQGTYMITRLLQEVVEPDDALRARLIAALPIGGAVSVPEGETLGTFANLPLCTSAEETGCVIAYRTYGEGYPPTAGAQAADAPGRVVACTDPVALVGGTKLAGAYFPTFSFQPAVFPPLDFGRTYETPFVLYRDYYATTCATDSDGNHYLEVSVDPEPADTRPNPVDFGLALFSPSFLGLHILDYNFPLTELMDLVATKAGAM